MRLGALGVLGFCFSLPATRLALRDLDPWLVAFGRALVAARLAARACGHRARRARRARSGARWRSSPLGVVVGFPLLTSLALHHADRRRTARSSSRCCPPRPRSWRSLRAGERPVAALLARERRRPAAVLAFVAADAARGGLAAADL